MTQAEGSFEPCAPCRPTFDDLGQVQGGECERGGSGIFFQDSCTPPERDGEECQCGGGYESNFLCDINEKEYDKIEV